MKIDWKKIAPYLVALVVFVGFAVLYCSPQFNGKVLQQGDINNWKGAANEALSYYETNGEPTGWTNSMFSGMPTYQITFRNAANMATSWVKNQLVNLWGEPITAILLYFIGFYLMLLCFGINAWLALIGALALGLSSYFFIIIPAGHMSKAFALGGLAPVIGGIYAIYLAYFRQLRDCHAPANELLHLPAYRRALYRRTLRAYPRQTMERPWHQHRYCSTLFRSYLPHQSIMVDIKPGVFGTDHARRT